MLPPGTGAWTLPDEECEQETAVTTFQAPKGTYDLLPPDSAVYLAVREAIAAPVRNSGYGYVETPGFEDVELFARGVGESTDIVTKEMYTLTTKGGSRLALRPEGTASVLRAALEANLHKQGALPVKLWYSGSYYRYERPQKGRYRHFSQVGAEAIGAEDPALDVELIILADQAYRSLGLRGFRTLLNSLGDAECRPVYREALQGFLRGLDLDEDTRRRVEINPLRVLDDKRAEVQKQLVGVPLLRDHLCDACRAYHREVRELLTEEGVSFEDDEKLVRGLDYYTRTTFEFVHDGLGSQSALGGGGRYDGLSEMIGGPALPSVGWALGVDRTVLALRAEGVELDIPPATSVFAVPLGDQARRALFGVVTQLRRAGVAADFSYGGRGLKGAMKAANRSGARYTIVAGERDLAEGIVQLKDMETGEQSPVPLSDVVETVRTRLG
jgi:histidyl-tRNA synthetase